MSQGGCTGPVHLPQDGSRAYLFPLAGNDFVYNDDFSMTKEERKKYEKLSGEVNEYGERLVKNTKDDGRYHSKWLNMMYTRLKVSKDLLKEDGVILISIDDNEVHNNKKK